MAPTTLSQIELARLVLVRGARSSDPELTLPLQNVARVAASTLAADRVGIWSIEANWQGLHCHVLYDRRTDSFSSGSTLKLSDYPLYAHALKERRVIAAEDALTDPRTRELSTNYLEPNGILSLLDCPVYEDGEVVAIVCHESVGATRAWTSRDRDFAASVADIVATLFTQVALIRFESELRAAREELAQTRVMDSLGRMAAQVAHDFNNILMGVSLAVRVMQEEHSAEPAKAAAADAIALIDQGARLVKHLLTFARQEAYSGQPADAHAVLSAMLGRLRRMAGEDVSVEMQLEPGPALVRMDPPVLEQVLSNLVVNARDAMPGGGEIVVHSSRKNGALELTVQDTGLGMDPATCQLAFEPFFTTKAERGTGLGLAIVFSAVRSAGGRVQVESQPARGSTFLLELPLCVEVEGS